MTAPPLLWVKALDMVMDKLIVEGVEFANVKALSGAAQVLSAFFFLILVSWYISAWRHWSLELSKIVAILHVLFVERSFTFTSRGLLWLGPYLSRV